MKLRLKLSHMWWGLLLALVGFGWSMYGVTNPDEWRSAFSLLAFGNLVFAALWIIEREKRDEMRRLLDPDIQRYFR